jgi:AAA ATPase domain
MVRLILPDLESDRETPFWSAIGPTLLVGYDVNGFTGTLDREVTRVGRLAGEVSASALIRGGRAVSSILSELSLLPVELIGDGILYLADLGSNHPDVLLEKYIANACQKHVEAAGLAIRAAWSRAEIYRLSLGGLISNQSDMLLGPGLAQLHNKLAIAPRSNTSSQEDSGPNSLDWVMDANGTISDEYCVVARLYQSNQWEQVKPAELVAGLIAISEWTAALGGRIERAAHDEKGIHVRLYFSPTAVDDHALQSGLEALVFSLCAKKFSCAAALRRGMVFRGLEDESWQIHGDAINHAAKSCAQLSNGQVSGIEHGSNVTSLQIGSNGSRILIGRKKELYCLEEQLGQGGARCVSLRGEAGIGKSTLARHLYERQMVGRNSIWFKCNSQTPVQPFAAVRAALTSLFSSIDHAKDTKLMRAMATEVMRKADIPNLWHDHCLELCGEIALFTNEIPSIEIPFRPHYLSKFALAILEKLSEQKPVLIAIDDAQLMDTLSASVFAAMLESRISINLIFTSRPSLGKDNLLRIEAHQSTLTLPIQPLNASMIREIARHTFPRLNEDEMLAIQNISNGNAFIARQAALWMESTSERDASSISRLLSNRVASLLPFERLLLRIISVSGGASRVEFVERSARQIGFQGDFNAALAELKSKKLIQDDNLDIGLVEPAHDLISVAVKSEMSAGSAILVHRSAGRVYWRDICHGVRPRSDLLQLAAFWIGGQSFGRGAICLARSAETALSDGYSATAAELFSRAITAADSAGLGKSIRVANWHSRHSEVLWAIGELTPAHTAALKSLQILKSFGRTSRTREVIVRSANMRSETGYFTGNFMDIFSGNLTIARASLGGLQQSLAQGRSNSTLGYIAGVLRMPWLSNLLFSGAKELGRNRGDQRPEAYACAADGILQMLFCRWNLSEGALASALECLTDLENEHQLIEVILTSQGHCAANQGNVANAMVKFGELKERSMRRGHKLHQGWALYMQSLMSLCDEDLDPCATALASAECMLHELGDRKSLHIMKGIRTRLHWDRGEFEQALSSASLTGQDSLANGPTNFSSLEGYAAAPMIGALAMLRGGPLRDRGDSLVKAYLRPLRTFAQIYPFARPRLATVNALIALGQKHPTSHRKVDYAVALSQKLGMNTEAALAKKLFFSAVL